MAFSSAGMGLIMRCQFEENTADQYGGVGFTSSSASVELVHCEMNHNEAAYGGGWYVSDSSHVSISESVLSENKATQYGGAIYQTTPTRLDITDVNVTSNVAIAGGAMFSEYPQLNIARSYFSHNNASGWGGALMLTMTSDSLISIQSSVFS